MKKTIKIEGMHCSHCLTRVTNALSALGVKANATLPDGIATVEGDNIPEDNVLRETIEDLGFDVLEIK